MTDSIILSVVIIIVVSALIQTVKHFAKKSGCCGSGDYKPKKKKLKHIMATKVFLVDGMHCETCSNRVMEVINDIPHVSAQVKLKTGEVTVSYEQEVPDDLIRRQIERAGYSVRNP